MAKANREAGATGDMFEMAREYEAKRPGVKEAMDLLGVSMEKYEAALSALYTPKVITAGSTKDLHADVE